MDEAMSDNDPRLRVVRGDLIGDFNYDYTMTIDCSINPTGAASEVARLRAEVERLRNDNDPLNRQAGSCGGCRDLGAHIRWCPEAVGPYAAEVGRWSHLADSWGDKVGPNDPALANALWSLAAELNSYAERIKR